MKKLTILAALFCVASTFSAPVQAHFQLLYTPVVNLEKPTNLPLKLIFWHPFENGHVMDMGKPEAFYYVYRGKETDLSKSLKSITFTGQGNAGAAFEAVTKIKRNGDYIFVLNPEPYFEESEDIYIRQLTKSYVNKGGVPTGWNEPLGLPVEIVPLNKPTNILVGSTFSGQVLSEGKPVAGAELEIEYIAAEPDMAANKPKQATVSPMPGGSVVAIADEQGRFTFGIPKAGFWGFAALGAGPEKTYKGKELSHDAVIWIRAYDVK